MNVDQLIYATYQCTGRDARTPAQIRYFSFSSVLEPSQIEEIKAYMCAHFRRAVGENFNHCRTKTHRPRPSRDLALGNMGQTVLTFRFPRESSEQVTKEAAKFNMEYGYTDHALQAKRDFRAHVRVSRAVAAHVG